MNEVGISVQGLADKRSCFQVVSWFLLKSVALDVGVQVLRRSRTNTELTLDESHENDMAVAKDVFAFLVRIVFYSGNAPCEVCESSREMNGGDGTWRSTTMDG